MKQKLMFCVLVNKTPAGLKKLKRNKVMAEIWLSWANQDAVGSAEGTD